MTTALTRLLLAFVTWLSLALPGYAQSNEPLVFGTVHRPPFAYTDGDKIDGFSIELMRLIADEIGREVVFEPNERFGDMLDSTRAGRSDGAIANISITAERERVMDYSQPIFGGGIQVMMPAEVGVVGQVWSLITWDILSAVLIGLVSLAVIGMLMWLLERKHQPYFDLSAGKALFPSFWWALNLVVHGGFEERRPRSPLGMVLSVTLVIGSLFLISLFVASITAAATLTALQANVSSIRDLENRVVGTIAGSTSDDFLDKHSINFQGFGNLDALIEAFERDEINTVVFDGPVLAHYIQTDGAGTARLLDKIYRPENYGILLQSGSDLKEEIDQALLSIREAGEYDRILKRWFGNSFTAE